MKKQTLGWRIKEEARGSNAPGPAGHFPALTWLSLVGLLLSIAQLRFTRQLEAYHKMPLRIGEKIQNQPNAPTGSPW
jgi:hypothetical protein